MQHEKHDLRIYLEKLFKISDSTLKSVTRTIQATLRLTFMA